MGLLNDSVLKSSNQQVQDRTLTAKGCQTYTPTLLQHDRLRKNLQSMLCLLQSLTQHLHCMLCLLQSLKHFVPQK